MSFVKKKEKILFNPKEKNINKNLNFLFTLIILQKYGYVCHFSSNNNKWQQFFPQKFNFTLIKVRITYGCLAESVLSADKKCGTHVCFFSSRYPTDIACKALSIQILLHGYMPIKAIKPSNILWIKKVWCFIFWYFYFIFRKEKKRKWKRKSKE